MSFVDSAAPDAPIDEAKEAASARQAATVKTAKAVTHDTPAALKPLPRVSTPEEARNLAPGSSFIGPDDETHVVPYRVKSPQELSDVPEGADFIGPDGQLRQKPTYQGIDFTPQTLFNMATNDKERRKALEHSYPGKVKELPGTGELYVDDEGVLRKPRGFSQAPGAFLASQAAPVGLSIGGDIAGGVGGSMVAPGAGTVAGAIGGGAAGGAIGQGFNDIILQLAGVYDRTGTEEAAELGMAGAMGGVGSGVGRAVSAVAPSVKGAMQRAGGTIGKFLGADADNIATAVGLREKGVDLVPVSPMFREAPHLQNVVETLDPAFRTQKPLQQAARKHYESTAGDILTDLGVAPKGSVVEPVEAPATQKVGRTLQLKALEDSFDADLNLHNALESAKTSAKAGLPFREAEQQALAKAAEESRAAADKLIEAGFKDIDQDVQNALKLGKAGTNTGDAWKLVGKKLQAKKQALQARASKMYNQVDVLAGEHLPDVRGLPELADSFLQEIPKEFENRYPSIVQKIRQFGGVQRIAQDEEGNMIGQMVKPPIQPTYGQLHELRSMLRDGADWYTLSGDVKNGSMKFFAKRIDDVLHDVNAVPELQAAAKQLDKSDKWYAKNMAVFNAKEVDAIMNGLRSGEPADPAKLFATIVKENQTDLTNKILKLVGPNIASSIRALDVKSMLDNSKSLVPGQIDGQKFVREVLERHRSGMLETLQSPETSEKLLKQARYIAAMDGKIDVQTMPGDTALDVLTRARTAAEAAKKAAQVDPLKVLSVETKKAEQEFGKARSQLQRDRKNEPLGFLHDPTVGATEAANKILGNEDLLLAAGARFGPQSPEFNALRQVWVQRLLQNTMDPSAKLANVSPEVQNLMFPGVKLDQMKLLAKEMDFLLSAKGSGGGTGKSIMATQRVEHPWGAIPGGKAVGKFIPGVDAAGRAMLGSYYKMVTELSNNLPFLKWVERGLKGDEAARLMTKEAVQLAMQRGGAVGAGAGESLHSTPADPNRPIKGYAEGGVPPVGEPIVVGEQGSEVIVPPVGEPIVVGEQGSEVIVPQQPVAVVPNPATQAQQGREVAAQRVQGRVQPKDFTPSIAEFLQSIPTGALHGLARSVRSGMGGDDATILNRMQQPGLTTEKVEQDVQNVTGPVHVPQGPSGEAGALLGDVFADPTGYTSLPAAKVAMQIAPRMLKPAAGIAAGAATPSTAERAVGEETPENVPVGERPQTGEWWRTKRAPPPQLPQFVPPTLSPEETKQFEEQPWTPPKNWKGDREQRQDWEGPKAYLDRVTNLRAAGRERETRRVNAAEKKVADAMAEREKEQTRLNAEYQKEQERIDKLDQEFKEANENFRRRHPVLATAMPLIGAGIGGAIPYAARTRLQGINNKLVSDFENAIERAETAAAKTGPLGKTGTLKEPAAMIAEKAGAQKDLISRLDPKTSVGLARGKQVDPSAGTMAASATMGAAGSVEGALAPYELDLALPNESPDKKEATNPMNWVERGAQQILPGALAGSIGGKLPVMKKPLTPDIERAQGLIKRLEPPVAKAPGAPKAKKSPVASGDLTPDQIKKLEAALVQQLQNQQALKAAR